MNKTQLLFLVGCIFGVSSIFAQSDKPCEGGGAPALTVGTTCSYTSGTTVGATKNTNAANGGTP